MNLYGKNYRLVFEDNFDAEKLDTDIWTPFDYADNTRDGKKAWRKPENVTLENGNLVIRGKILENGDYTSGMIKTNKHMAYKYGYAEIRAKMPIGGKGVWPGFWMCAPQYPGRGAMPEIDVLEMFGDDSYIACNLHSWWWDKEINGHRHINYLDGQGYPKTKRLPGGAKFSEDYHTIGYEWTSELVQFLVDGEPYCTVKINNPMFSVFHEPIYFILSMAYRLPFLSAPENNGVPVEYMIDYIRLYQNDDGVLYRIEEDNSLTEVKSIEELKSKNA